MKYLFTLSLLLAVNFLGKSQQSIVQIGGTADFVKFFDRETFVGPKVSYQYLINDTWGIEIKSAITSVKAGNIYEDLNQGEDYDGNVSFLSIIPNANYYFLGSSESTPYLSVGPGFFDQTLDYSYRTVFGTTTIKGSDSIFGGNITGGYQAFITDQFMIDINGGYTVQDSSYSTISIDIGYNF